MPLLGLYQGVPLTARGIGYAAVRRRRRGARRPFLGPGDEVLTSDEEHVGLLAPLAGAAGAAV